MNSIQFGSLDEQSDITNILYYGFEGTGKTTAAASMANLGKIVYINAEAGLKKRALITHGIDTSNISVYPNTGELLTFDGLESLFWQMLGDLQDDPNAWAGVVWDSLTDIHLTLLRNIADAKLAKQVNAGMDVDRFFIDRSWYGTMTEQLRLLLRRYRDLPCHFAMTALVRRDQDDDGAVTYGPAITPALQNDVMGYVDLVCVTEVVDIGGEETYTGTFRPKAKYRAKERLAGAVPRMLIDPTFERVHLYATEQVDQDHDPVMVSARKRRDAAVKDAAK
jgi:hypothetical protein